MARPSTFHLIKFKKYLNVCHSYIDTRSSLNKISVRYLRGSRFSKDHNQEELKYQRLLKTLKYDQKPLEPEVSSNENISSEQQETSNNATEGKNNEDTCGNTVHIRRLTPDDIIRKFQHKMMPWGKLPYALQIIKKYRRCCGVMKYFGRQLKVLKVPIAMGEDKLPCPVDIIVPSPIIEVYRNRDDFSIGLGLDGNEKTVGYLLDPPTDDAVTFCMSPRDVPILKASHRRFAEDFQEYIRSSPLPASTHYNDKGYWKNLIVRSNIKGDLMGIVVMHPQTLSQEEIQAEKEKLKEFFTSAPAGKYKLHSLYFQTCIHSRCTHEQSPFELLLGEPCIVETVNNMTFHISPDSFFYMNTNATETMLNVLLKLCRVNKSTTILDIACGVGPVSLQFSPRVKKCIGIDDSVQAIVDAKLNAVENRSQNTEFIHGRPEAVIKDILNEEFHEDLLVVLNSSRCVINKRLITMLRELKYVEKIVYISSRPTISMDNYIELCKPPGPNRKLGKGFLPILVVPYDNSPCTENYGLIMMFQRL